MSPQERDEQPWQCDVSKAEQSVTTTSNGRNTEQHWHTFTCVTTCCHCHHHALFKNHRRNENPPDIVKKHNGKEHKCNHQIGQSQSPLDGAEETCANDVLEDPAIWCVAQ